jgi:hypothetical protein
VAWWYGSYFKIIDYYGTLWTERAYVQYLCMFSEMKVDARAAPFPLYRLPSSDCSQDIIIIIKYSRIYTIHCLILASLSKSVFIGHPLFFLPCPL